ncbi:MAG: phosphate ABC transporter substrate-binding protein PstS [Propionicimonas sp.]
MKTTRFAGAALALATAVSLVGCATNEQPQQPASPAPGGESTNTNAPAALSGKLAGSGASSQGKAQEAWIATFTGTNPDVSIAYDGGGSGAGRTAFAQGGVEYAGSDRALKVAELEDPVTAFKLGSGTQAWGKCAADSGIVELPLYISPIAIGYNLEGVAELNLDASTLAKIFAGKIAKWNDPAIVALNPDATLPDLAITTVHRSTNSGTTENFTDYLAKTAPEDWTYEVSGDWPAELTGGEGAAETGDVASILSSGAGTIGYLDASRAPGSTVSLKVGDQFVKYSPEGAAAVVAGSPLEEGRKAFDLAVTLDRTTTDPTHYPLVLISYLIGCEKYADANTGALVKSYFSYIASPEGQDLAAAQAGAAPISDALRTQVTAAIDAIS